MRQIIKLNESQLRGIIRETLGKILNENVYDEGRKRTRPSYYEIEDYRQVPGVDLCIKIDNLIRMKNPKNRNLDYLINFMMQNSDVLHLYIDEENNCLHSFFYHGSQPAYTERDNSIDEDFWYKQLGEPTMKGIAKQIPVMLYEHVPDFEEIWKEETEQWKKWREEDKKRGEEVVGKGVSAATSYDTVPTIGTL